MSLRKFIRRGIGLLGFLWFVSVYAYPIPDSIAVRLQGFVSTNDYAMWNIQGSIRTKRIINLLLESLLNANMFPFQIIMSSHLLPFLFSFRIINREIRQKVAASPEKMEELKKQLEEAIK